MSIFVKMKDNFMSGWGGAEGKANLYVVECDNQQQADHIIRAADDRSEMSGIRQLTRCPKDSAQVVVSLKQFNDLGEVWTEA